MIYFFCLYIHIWIIYKYYYKIYIYFLYKRYNNYKQISIKEKKDNYSDIIKLEFDILINISDNGYRDATYIFNALANWIRQKHEDKIAHSKKEKRSQSDEKSDEKKVYSEYEIIVKVKDDR